MTPNELRLKQEDKEEKQTLGTIIDNQWQFLIDSIDFYQKEYDDFTASGFVHTMPFSRYLLLALSQELKQEK
jgi:hypothetical protein